MAARPLPSLAAGALVACAAAALASTPVPGPPLLPSPSESAASVRSGPLALTVRAERASLAAGQASAVALVEIEADEGASDPSPRPLAAVIVVDTSGSMTGRKIEDARAGAAHLVGRLADDDVLGIVAFETGGHRILEPLRVGDARGRAAGAVTSLEPGGSTCMSCGLEIAWEMLAAVPATFDRRILLFSDGQPNEGNPHPDDLVAFVAAARATDGITTSTVGLGTGYDANLLNRLAVAGTGVHLFSPGPGAIAGILDRELARIRGVVARDVTVALEPGPGVELAGAAAVLEVGTLAAGERRRFLVPVAVSPDASGPLLVARLREASASLALRRASPGSPGPPPPDPVVAAFQASMAASEARTQALSVAAAGDRESARVLLEDALGRLHAAHASTGEGELVFEIDETSKQLEGLLQWTAKELESMTKNAEAAELETKQGVKARKRWNSADLLDAFETY